MKPHWTDAHILWNNEVGSYVSYDEAGLAHCEHKTKEEAKEELVRYGALLESANTKKQEK